MRPTGVVSKKVTGARTRLARELRWMMREARSAEYRLDAERSTVSVVKPGGREGREREVCRMAEQ